jgi:hypothetical protein
MMDRCMDRNVCTDGLHGTPPGYRPVHDAAQRACRPAGSCRRGRALAREPRPRGRCRDADDRGRRSPVEQTADGRRRRRGHAVVPRRCDCSLGGGSPAGRRGQRVRRHAPERLGIGDRVCGRLQRSRGDHQAVEPSGGAYFDGVEDDRIRVLQLHMEHGEFWSAPGHGPLGRLVAVVSAAIGADTGSGDRGRIQP